MDKKSEKESNRRVIRNNYPVPARWVAISLLVGLLLSACTTAAPQPPAPPPTQPTAAAPTPTQALPQPTPTADLSAQLVDQLWLLVAYGDATIQVTIT